MQLINKQLSERISNILADKDGLNDALGVVLDSLMLAERSAFISECNNENKANGFRPGIAFVHGIQLELEVPRDCQDNF